MGRRLLTAVAILIAVIHVGAWGYYELLEGNVTYFDCLYRTTLLISTVNEPGAFEQIAPERQGLIANYTMFVLLVGMGLVLYCVSTFAAWIIESDLRGGVRRRRTRKMVARLHDHIIVCGGGETGQFIAAELQKVGREFVVIEKDEERSDRLSRKPGMHVLNGDATEDATLEEAGIDRATGVIAALTGDKDNLFVVITARQLNAGVKIVARTVDPTADRKLNQAGADVVIAASTIAADRMVSAMVRPHVVSLFDRLLRDPASTHRIEEVRVESGSELAGSTLGEAHLGRRTGLLVLAIQPPGSHFECNPTVDTKLAADSLLVVMGDVDNFDQLHRMAAGRSSV